MALYHVNHCDCPMGDCSCGDKDPPKKTKIVILKENLEQALRSLSDIKEENDNEKKDIFKEKQKIRSLIKKYEGMSSKKIENRIKLLKENEESYKKQIKELTETNRIYLKSIKKLIGIKGFEYLQNQLQYIEEKELYSLICHFLHSYKKVKLDTTLHSIPQKVFKEKQRHL